MTGAPAHTRLFQLLFHLLHRPNCRATAPELAEVLGVSVRTVYRDVDVLSRARVPICTEAGRRGGIYLLQPFVLDWALFAPEERRELLSLTQSLTAVQYPGEGAAVQKLSVLLRDKPPDWLEVDFSRWGRRGPDGEKFQALRGAVLNRREVEMIYLSSSGRRSRRTVRPLQLSYRSRSWYLKAYCLQRQDYRLFKLNRILALTLLERVFEPMPCPAAEAASACAVPVVLRVAGEAAHRLYDEFDDAQLAQQEDGSYLVTAEMPLDGWLVGYLLSYGARAEVLSPSSLREAVAQQAEKICAVYKKP